MDSVHIKDSYFINAQAYLKTPNTYLMSNKEDGKYRPHFLCFNDKNNSNILWAIPQSTKTEKYNRLAQEKTQKYGRCDTIVIGDFAGRSNAFLIQNMFPISANYIDHIHTINGVPVSIHRNLESEIINKAKRALNIYKYNKNIIFPDIDKLYKMVLNELN